MSTKLAYPVTLSAVARHAGVSVATVSYVLNGVQLSRIPPRTQTRVKDAARELGYVPNASARSLRVGRSDLVIAHLPGGRSMMQRAAAGLDQLGSYLREVGYTLLVHSDTTLRGQTAAQLWSGLRPAALITEHGLLDSSSIELLHRVGTIVIAIAQRTTPSPLPTLVIDDSALGEVAVQHLIERGCRDITMLMPADPRARVRARLRLTGARRAARASKAKGVCLSLATMVDEPAQAAQLVETWRSSRRPEGVFGFDDAHSGLLLGALNDAGVRVPQELALVGADDQQLCDMLRPRLSSVAIAMDNFRAFAEPVVSAIRGKWTQGVVSERWPAVLKQRET